MKHAGTTVVCQAPESTTGAKAECPSWRPSGLISVDWVRRDDRRQSELRQYSRSFTRSRAIAWLCSWQTRDSVTFSTAAISLRFMSCS